jgi:hypothetical protein
MNRSRIARAPASVLALTFLCAPRAFAQGSPAPPAPSETGPEAEIAQVIAPVVLDGETLFRVRGASHPGPPRSS